MGSLGGFLLLFRRPEFEFGLQVDSDFELDLSVAVGEDVVSHEDRFESEGAQIFCDFDLFGGGGEIEGGVGPLDDVLDWLANFSVSF